jgi:hypothetical protein
MNIIIMIDLMMTMTVFAVVEWRMPATKMSVHAATTPTAGTFATAPVTTHCRVRGYFWQGGGVVTTLLSMS